MNITINIKDTKYTVDEEVAQYIFCLKMQITSLNKAVEIYSKPTTEVIVGDDERKAVVQRPFKGRR